MTMTNAGWSRRGALLSLLAGGCVALPGQGPGPREYRLTAKSTFPPDLPKVRWGLSVTEPDAQRTVDTNRVALIRQGVEVAYLADVVWIDRAPSMIQDLIVQSFVNSGAIATVGTDRDRLDASFLLRTILRTFQVQGAPGSADSTAQVGFDATLLAVPQRNSGGTTTIAKRSPVAAASVQAVIDAFEDAMGQALKELVTWTLKTGQAAPAIG